MRVVDPMPAWSALVALLALVALVAGVVVASRRARGAGFGGGGLRERLRALMRAAPSSPLECSASMRLTPRQTLHVVEWDGRRLLVGCSEQSICLIAESPLEGHE